MILTGVKKVILCSGFRKSGKDFLFRQIKENGIESFPYNWKIIREDKNLQEEFLPMGTYITDSFAAILKQEVRKIFGIEVTDQNKDQPLENGLTPRRYCIDLALFRRRENPAYFAESVMRKYYIDHHSDKILYISDWRYHNEYETAIKYFGKESIITIRLHSCSNLVPPLDAVEEHQLDNFNFDLILERD